MLDIFLVLSAFMSAIAAIVIAYFTKKNIELTKSTVALNESTLALNESIQESSQSHQNDMKKLQVDLVAASLYAATNPPGKSLQTGKLKEFRKIVEEGN